MAKSTITMFGDDGDGDVVIVVIVVVVIVVVVVVVAFISETVAISTEMMPQCMLV